MPTHPKRSQPMGTPPIEGYKLPSIGGPDPSDRALRYRHDAEARLNAHAAAALGALLGRLPKTGGYGVSDQDLPHITAEAWRIAYAMMAAKPQDY